jgi:hypothetical protein
MDQMTNEFGDRLDRLERQYANNHGGVQNKPKQKELNVRMVVRRVNTDVDEFVADNVGMSDIDFEDVFMGHGERFEQQQIISLEEKDMVIILAKEVVIGIRIVMLSLVEIRYN